MEKSWDQIAKRWRENLVNKLQERYGLAAEDAQKKADVWLRWIVEQPSPPPETMLAEVREEHSPPRPRAQARPGKPKSRPAENLNDAARRLRKSGAAPPL
jgi:hypothetical protein